MSRDVAIRVENLGKRYRIGGRGEPYKTLRDVLARTAALPARVLRAMAGGHRAAPRRNDEIWALKDVSLEVARGEVVGIIGRNGAGKSTLLKILSRITEPTAGWAEIRGRVGSLLEVGTGFHPELTGRENVFLNGAILGMRRNEIMNRFDEIVSFAEVEKFVDTPLKHYSSGMSLRLAFSVAAHLDPEILLVDEVLAVGDLAFQKKCVRKMDDVAGRGRTVLFVSHNLGAVKSLCQTGIVLDAGAVVFRGSAVEGVARYAREITASTDDWAESNASTRWREVRVNGRAGGLPAEVPSGEPVTVEATLDVRDQLIAPQFKCTLDDASGDRVIHQVMDGNTLDAPRLEPGSYGLRVEFPPLWLAAGVYTLRVKVSAHNPSGGEERAESNRIMIDVTGDWNGRHPALLAPPARWGIGDEVGVGRRG